MRNTAYLPITVKLSPSDHAAVSGKSNRSAWVRNAIREKLEREGTAGRWKPKSRLGAKLLAARREYTKAGGRLLSLDEISQEVARRRGER